MLYYKIIVAYDGTDFHGWQQQPKDLTVHTCMQKAFEKTFNKKAELLAVSRTDSGVHALGQVVRLKAELEINPQKLKTIWNRALPKSILIRDIRKIDSDFHPFFNVDYKIYHYNLFLKEPLPFVSRYGWHYKFMDQVDLDKFEKALQLYIGKHDFASFCKLEKDNKKTTIRTIDQITLKKISKFNMLRIEIKGKSFLRFQIRRMIGYALDISRRQDLSLEYLEKILKNPNPRQVLLKAAACGLCLRKVVYKNGFNIKKREL
ncbi:tRNA pseudouridine(38-40) synthase TruA [Candidatus Dependentiae bacterium]|nr:tRNA pseudouridine(38-40) synthase TruA [Candidatus Dependentiae bacterium]